MTRLTLALAATSALLLPSCYSSAVVLSRDAGPDGSLDADPLPDVIHGIEIGALPDTWTPDAWAPDSGDAGACDPLTTITFIDPFEQREIEIAPALSLFAAGPLFRMIYSDGDETRVLTAGERGEITTTVYTPWPPSEVDGYQAGRFWAAAWSANALYTANWGSSETVAVTLAGRLLGGNVIAAASFDVSEEGVLVAAQRPAAGRDFDQLQLLRVGPDLGDPIEDVPVPAVFAGEPHRALGLHGDLGVYVTAIQQWDFPPTVQVGATRGTSFSLAGSSCGVDSYAVASNGAAPDSGLESVAIAHGCAESGSRDLVLTQRFVRRPDAVVTLARDRHARLEVPDATNSPIAITARREGGWVVAYWNESEADGFDGFLRILVLREDLTIERARNASPRVQYDNGETPGPVALGQAGGGVYAIAWANGNGGGFRRFTLGCP